MFAFWMYDLTLLQQYTFSLLHFAEKQELQFANPVFVFFYSHILYFVLFLNFIFCLYFAEKQEEGSTFWEELHT